MDAAQSTTARMFLLLLSSLASTSTAEGPDTATCLPAAWLPQGSDVAMCSNPGLDYDGSLVPDCSAFRGPGSNTSFFHVHEYGKIVPYHPPFLQIVASSGSAVLWVRVSWSAPPAITTRCPARTVAFSSTVG